MASRGSASAVPPGRTAQRPGRRHGPAGWPGGRRRRCGSTPRAPRLPRRRRTMRSRAGSPAAGGGRRSSRPSSRTGPDAPGSTSTIPAAVAETVPVWNRRTQSSPSAIVALACHERACGRRNASIIAAAGRAASKSASGVARLAWWRDSISSPRYGPDSGGGQLAHGHERLERLPADLPADQFLGHRLPLLALLAHLLGQPRARRRPRRRVPGRRRRDRWTGPPRTAPCSRSMSSTALLTPAVRSR